MITSPNPPLTENATAEIAGESIRWRPLAALVVGGFAVGYLLCRPYASHDATAAKAIFATQELQTAEAPNALRLPDKSLTPEQVVATQMDALAAYRTDRSAIHQVFAFASPSNKSMTGPIARFEQMILQSPYNAMLMSNHWMAGRVVRSDGLATQLVTTIDADGKVSLFRFYLSVQTEQHPDCWMTDHVVCLFQNGSQRQEGFSANPLLADQFSPRTINF